MPDNVVSMNQSTDQRPVVEMRSGQAHLVIDRVLDIVAALPVPVLYCQGGSMVEIIHRGADTVVQEFTRHVLANKLNRLIKFVQVSETPDGRQVHKNKDCSKDLAQTILEMGAWPNVPNLNGILTHRTIRPDGSLINEPGYDRLSGFYLRLSSSCDFEIPKNQGAAKSALDKLTDLFSEYPYATDADRAALLAMVVSGVIRPALLTCPAFGLNAPTPGTGKTHCSRSVMLIAAGRIPPVLPLSGNPQESEKIFSAALQARMPILFCDNIVTVINWGFLQPILTSDWASLRVLGVSRLVDVPTNSLVVFNGNNLSITSDLVRRFLMVNFDSGLERPEQRVFKKDIHGYIGRNRGVLVRYVLSIVTAYIEAGSPDVSAPESGYPEWDRLVRFPLIWLGLPDPLEANKTLRSDDSDTQTIAAMCTTLHRITKALGIQEFTASSVVGFLDSHDVSVDDRADLREALLMACGDNHGAGPVGTWLSNNKDRPVGGLKVVRSRRDKCKKHNIWIIEQSGNSSE